MIRLYFTPLPLTVHGIVSPADIRYPDTVVVINSSLPVEQQADAFRHEAAHVFLGHVTDDTTATEDIERAADAWKAENVVIG